MKQLITKLKCALGFHYWSYLESNTHEPDMRYCQCCRKEQVGIGGTWW